MFRNDFWGQNITGSASHKSYRPLTVLTFKLGKSLASGLLLSHARVQHAINVLVHAFNSVLVYTWINQFHPSLSLTVSVLFALHPVHVDSVAGVVGRADLLYSLCVLIALNNHKAGAGTMVALASVATLFKEQGVMLLPLVVAQDALCHHRFRIRRVSPFRRQFNLKVNDFHRLKVS